MSVLSSVSAYSALLMASGEGLKGHQHPTSEMKTLNLSSNLLIALARSVASSMESYTPRILKPRIDVWKPPSLWNESSRSGPCMLRNMANSACISASDQR